MTKKHKLQTTTFGILRSLLLIIAALAIIDQFIFIATKNIIPDLTSWTKIFTDYAKIYDSNRPQFIVIGSSRAQEIAPLELLEEIGREHSLPHQFTNLSIGGGGTPSLLYAALEQFTPFVSDLPEGSRVIYGFSYFEMNHLQMQVMKTFDNGFNLLEQFQLVNGSHWAYRFSNHSGFARIVAKDIRERILPRWIYRILDESTTPYNYQRTLDQTCNFAGRYGYQILPINDWALRKMREKIGDKLVLTVAPVSDRQKVEDHRFGVSKIGGNYLNRFIEETKTRLFIDDNLHLSDDAFSNDCDHIRERLNKITYIESIIKAVE